MQRCEKLQDGALGCLQENDNESDMNFDVLNVERYIISVLQTNYVITLASFHRELKENSGSIRST